MSLHDPLFTVGAVGLAAVPVLAIAWPLWREARWAAWALPLGLLSVALVTYLAVGRPGVWGDHVSQQQPTPPNDAAASAPAGEVPPIGNAQVAAMVERLADRLQRNPNDPAGWRMLIRSYETLARFDEAVLAWQRLFQINPPDADQLTEYAVALGMSQGQRLSGEPEQVLEQALKASPGHVQELALLGSAAYERGAHALAIQRWQQVLDHAPRDAEVRARIQAQIDRAKLLARQDTSARAKP